MGYHSELLLCPVSTFSEDDVSTLEEKLEESKKSWRTKKYVGLTDWCTDKKHVSCRGITFGGNDEDEKICSGILEKKVSLSEKRTPITNFDPESVEKYYLGSTTIDMDQVVSMLCTNKKCGKWWAGDQYNVVTHNCNTFISTVTQKILRFKSKLPSLGLSNMPKPVKDCKWKKDSIDKE